MALVGLVKLLELEVWLNIESSLKSVFEASKAIALFSMASKLDRLDCKVCCQSSQRPRINYCARKNTSDIGFVLSHSQLTVSSQSAKFLWSEATKSDIDRPFIW